jgi:F-type H+-transporting ATPase subunit c
MSKRMSFALLALLTLVVATPAFAQDHAVAGDASGVKWGSLAAGFTIAIAAFGGALGQGKAIVAACDAMGRNPGAAGPIRLMALIGLAFIESLVIYALIIAFMVK